MYWRDQTPSSVIYANAPQLSRFCDFNLCVFLTKNLRFDSFWLSRQQNFHVCFPFPHTLLKYSVGRTARWGKEPKEQKRLFERTPRWSFNYSLPNIWPHNVNMQSGCPALRALSLTQVISFTLQMPMLLSGHLCNLPIQVNGGRYWTDVSPTAA